LSASSLQKTRATRDEAWLELDQAVGGFSLLQDMQVGLQDVQVGLQDMQVGLQDMQVGLQDKTFGDTFQT